MSLPLATIITSDNFPLDDDSELYEASKDL